MVATESEEKTPAILAKHRVQVEDYLHKAVPPHSSDISTLLRYHLGWADERGNPAVSEQGKGLRASLCIFACEAVGGRQELALSAAAAIELVHNFSLIHDDIQDGDKERHHRPTVWAIWGTPKAIQAGNFMRILADLALHQPPHSKVPSETLATCSKLLTTAYLRTVEGQYLDLEFEGRTDINTASYLDMIARKTGALIQCSMQMGALLGNGHPKTVKAMSTCGKHLGAVFQIRDDYLGIWGLEEETGKAVGNDLRRRKNSLPLVHALDHAHGADREHLRSIYAKEQIEDTDVSYTLDLLASLRTPEYLQNLAQDHASKALKALVGIQLIPGANEELEELVEFLLTRQR